MKRRVTCLGVFLLLGTFASADELKLKDGTKIVGTIVGFEDNSFKVETSYGYALVRKDKVATIVISGPKKDAAGEKPAATEAKKAPPPATAEQAAKPPAPPLEAAAPAKKEMPVAAAPAEPRIREEVAGNSYTNHTYGFKMYKPPSWQVIEGAHKTLPNAVVAMGTSDESTLLVVGREPLRSTLDAQAAATERQLREIYENYRPLGEERTVVAGFPAMQRLFRGSVDGNDWSGRIISVARGNELFTIFGMTYADSDLIQIQENVIARAIASLQFTNK